MTQGHGRYSLEPGTRPFAAATAAALVAIGAMWLPWFRSGQAARNSFAAFRAAQILGIEWITPLRIFWFLLPAGFLLGPVCWFGRHHRVAIGVTVLLGLIVALAGGAMALLVGPEIGSAAATIGGCCTIVLAAAALRAQLQKSRWVS